MATNKVEFGGETLIDLTEDTVTPETLLDGVTAHAANGETINGKLQLKINGTAEAGQNVVKSVKRNDTDIMQIDVEYGRLPTNEDIENKITERLDIIYGGNAGTSGVTVSQIATVKKWAMLGDSITDLRTNRPNNYPYWIKYRNPDLSIQNLGIGGALICFDRDNYLSDGSPVNSLYTQAQSIDADTDIITIFGGINDYNWGVPIGDFPKNTDLSNFLDGYPTSKVNTAQGHNGIPSGGTFYQGCYRLAEYLRTTFPDVPIVWFCPLQVGYQTSETSKAWTNANNNCVYDFSDAIQDVARYWSIRCYDLGRQSMITNRLQSTLSKYFFDGFHPNANGSLIISRIIENEVRRACQEWGYNM